MHTRNSDYYIMKRVCIARTERFLFQTFLTLAEACVERFCVLSVKCKLKALVKAQERNDAEIKFTTGAIHSLTCFGLLGNNKRGAHSETLFFLFFFCDLFLPSARRFCSY